MNSYVDYQYFYCKTVHVLFSLAEFAQLTVLSVFILKYLWKRTFLFQSNDVCRELVKKILQYKGSSFPADRSKAVPLLQFFFVLLWFNVFLLSLFVFHFSFFLYLERVVLCDCAFPGYLQLYFHAWKKLQS